MKASRIKEVNNEDVLDPMYIEQVKLFPYPNWIGTSQKRMIFMKGLSFSLTNLKNGLKIKGS